MPASQGFVSDRVTSARVIPIKDGMRKAGDTDMVFSLNRWLSCRSEKELIALVKYNQEPVSTLRVWEKETLSSLMTVSGYQTETEQRRAERRCINRLSLSAAVEFCFRRDWLQIVSPMTLRKDPRLCIKMTEIGRIMASVMAGSPLVEPIKKHPT